VRVFLIILGALSMLLGFGCAVSGFGTFRVVDSDGYISSGPGEVTTTASAIVAPTNEIEDRSDDPGFREGKIRVRIRAARSDGGEVFIGIASAEAVEAYLRGSPYEVVREIEFDPWRTRGTSCQGDACREPRGGGGLGCECIGTRRAGAGLAGTFGVARFRHHERGRFGGVTVEANLAVKLPYVRGLAWR